MVKLCSSVLSAELTLYFLKTGSKSPPSCRYLTTFDQLAEPYIKEGIALVVLWSLVASESLVSSISNKLPKAYFLA